MYDVKRCRAGGVRQKSVLTHLLWNIGYNRVLLVVKFPNVDCLLSYADEGTRENPKGGHNSGYGCGSSGNRICLMDIEMSFNKSEILYLYGFRNASPTWSYIKWSYQITRNNTLVQGRIKVFLVKKYFQD